MKQEKAKCFAYGKQDHSFEVLRHFKRVCRKNSVYTERKKFQYSRNFFKNQRRMRSKMKASRKDARDRQRRFTVEFLKISCQQSHVSKRESYEDKKKIQRK
jgi:hypothetical protein